LRRSRHCCEQREQERSITGRASWPGYATTPGTDKSRTSGASMPARAGRMDAGPGEAALMPARTRQAARRGASAGRTQPGQHGVAETSRPGRDSMGGRDTAWPGQHGAAGIRLGRGADGRNMKTKPTYSLAAGGQDLSRSGIKLPEENANAGRTWEPGRGGKLGRRRPRARMPAQQRSGRLATSAQGAGDG
jgi:hypothetical protein